MKKGMLLLVSGFFALAAVPAWANSVQSIRQADKVNISGSTYQAYAVQCSSGRKTVAYYRDGKWFDALLGHTGSRYDGLSLEAFAKDFCR